MSGGRWSRVVGAVVVALAMVVVPSTSWAASNPVQPYGTNDFGGFRNILPPGTNGLDNIVQLAAFKAFGHRPPHNDDQLAMYHDLTTAAPNILESQIGNFFKDATFGVKAGQVGKIESPEPGVVIEWDKQYAVPHVYGDTRAELEFGIGWATAEDRLFLIDVLRHAGAGDLASFAGGSNAGMDEGAWASAPYTQQDLQRQVQYAKQLPGGRQIFSDATNFVAGINAYIAAAKRHPVTMMPGEYYALGMFGGPTPFTVENLISIGTMIGGELGNGGGDQLANAVLYENLLGKFGRERYAVAGAPIATGKPLPPGAKDHSGFATFLGFDAPDDPEAPTTERGKSFPYQTLPQPSPATLRTIALPDAESVQYVNHLVGGALPGSGGSAANTGATAASASGSVASAVAGARQGLLVFPRSMSNALLVSARDSASGHPLAVMGPQTSYFAPQILMEEDIHGPGIDADGASFPGVNMYVELGHGRDYAWSATSSGQNIIDTFAVPLCSPLGGKVSINSNYYRLQGRCVRMQTLTETESWHPTLVDSTPAGHATFQTQRTAYGLVIARATIDGRPVIYTNLRSTYMHELDSIVGFAAINDASDVRNPQQFFNAAYNITYTFNWLYADDKHIAYFNSGLNPVRAPNTDPLFPSWATYAWQGYHPSANLTPTSLTEHQTPQSAHPQTVDQNYLTSWNNKQAPGYGDPATGQEFASVYRSQLLDNNLNHYLAIRGGKLSLADVINAMGNAGTQDLRGVEVLPYAMRVIGRAFNPTLAHAVSLLAAWVASGAHRINREHPSASGLYDQADAVRIMDAWWPLLVKAEFGPVLGTQLLGDVEGEFSINDQPGNSGSHLGSAFDVGFYGIVQKDLRSVLRLHVAGPLNRPYCGGGSLALCRAGLVASLLQAAGESFDQVYPAEGSCAAGDQMCTDSIQYRALGGITQPGQEWINRPTFQQADEILGHGPQ
jgi:acyl-homoserine lactone acylase PvdQ